MEDTLYYSFRPTLARSGGDVWLLSTPNGCKGFFYQTWTTGGPDWFRMTATAEDCPRISPKQLALDRREFSDSLFNQEYLCEFGDSDSALVRLHKVLALFHMPILDYEIP